MLVCIVNAFSAEGMGYEMEAEKVYAHLELFSAAPFTRAGSSTCLIWQIFLPDALPDTAPKEFVSRSSLTY